MSKCPTPGCSGIGNNNPRYKTHRSTSGCPRAGIRTLSTPSASYTQPWNTQTQVSKCPTPGCSGIGNNNPRYKTHRSASGCPRAGMRTLSTPSASYTQPWNTQTQEAIFSQPRCHEPEDVNSWPSPRFAQDIGTNVTPNAEFHHLDKTVIHPLEAEPYQRYGHYVIRDSEGPEEADLAPSAANNLVFTEDASGHRHDRSSVEAREVISELMEAVNGRPLSVRVRRRHLLRSITKAVDDKSFSFFRPVEVYFSGEEAGDSGGPRRELFTLLMKEVVNTMGILEGAPGSMTFTYDIDLLHRKQYELGGRFLAWSVRNGGPGLHVLSNAVFQAMLGNDVQWKHSYIKHVTDYESSQYLPTLIECKDHKEYAAWLEGPVDELSLTRDRASWLISRGINKPRGVKPSEIPRLVENLLKHILFQRVEPAVQQFIKGMGDLWDMVTIYPDAMQPLFCGGYPKMTAGRLKELYSIQHVQWSNTEREDTIFPFK